MNGPQCGHTGIWLLNMLESCADEYLNFKMSEQSTGIIIFFLRFSRRLKRHPLRKLHQMSLKLCPSCLKTAHFRKFGVDSWFVRCDRLMIIQLCLSFPPHFTWVQVICVGDILTQDITKRSIFSQMHSWATRKPLWKVVHVCTCSLGIRSSSLGGFLLMGSFNYCLAS